MEDMLTESDFDTASIRNKTLNDGELFGDKSKRDNDSRRDYSPRLNQKSQS